jgi:hypothetical protein
MPVPFAAAAAWRAVAAAAAAQTATLFCFLPTAHAVAVITSLSFAVISCTTHKAPALQP